jgi:hypothetical protein
LIHYTTKTDAEDAIKRFNDKRCGCQILIAEPADNKNQPGRMPPPRSFIKK